MGNREMILEFGERAAGRGVGSLGWHFNNENEMLVQSNKAYTLKDNEGL